ncbi:MAG: protein phosphatase 2C domain-containing protein [Chloroflexota bacterium]
MFQVESSSLTHPGRKRSNNEDFVTYFEPGSLEDLRDSGSLYVVADGVGGEAEGERASQYAAEKVKHEYYQNPGIEPGERLRQAMRQASRDIYDYAEGRGRHHRMATTLVAAVVRGEKLTVANVGDSRAYLMRGAQAWQITSDHTTVGEMLKNRLITEDEARRSKAKNRLTRSLGGESGVHVDLFEDIPLQAGDKILLCSDGLTRYALSTDLVQFAAQATPEEVATRLVDFANQSGGVDNVSVIVVFIKPGEAGLVGAVTQPRGEAPTAIDLEDTLPPSPRRASGARSAKPAPAAKKTSWNWRRIAPLATAGLVLLGLSILALAWFATGLGRGSQAGVNEATLASALTPVVPTADLAASQIAATQAIETQVAATVQAQVALQAAASQTVAVLQTQAAAQTLESSQGLTLTQTSEAGLLTPSPAGKRVCVRQVAEDDMLVTLLGKKYIPDEVYLGFQCKSEAGGLVCIQSREILCDPYKAEGCYLIRPGEWVQIPEIESLDQCLEYQGEWAIWQQ